MDIGKMEGLSQDGKAAYDKLDAAGKAKFIDANRAAPAT